MSGLLLRGGVVYSDSHPFATALLVEGGQIAWLGDEVGADVQERLGTPRVRDLGGRLVAPGFVDAIGVCGAARPSDGVVHALSPATRREDAQLLPAPARLDGGPLCLDPLHDALDLADLSARGLPLAFGFSHDAPAGPWRRLQHALADGLSARAAFTAHTRGAWRVSRYPDAPLRGRLQLGSPATFAVWEAEELVHQAADADRSSWSLDSRSGLPPLPRLGAVGDESWEPPSCHLTMVEGEVLWDIAPPSDGGSATGQAAV